MQRIEPQARRYDAATIAFHWATALLVIFQWLEAQGIDWFPRGAPRADARSVHIVAGLLLALVLCGRVSWRLTRGRRLPPAERGTLGVLARIVHWGLYGLLLVMVCVGILLARARGDAIFGLLVLPSSSLAVPALRHRLQDLHATLGWIIVALTGLHAGAALLHHLVWRDEVLRRMLGQPRRGVPGGGRE